MKSPMYIHNYNSIWFYIISVNVQRIISFILDLGYCWRNFCGDIDFAAVLQGYIMVIVSLGG